MSRDISFYDLVDGEIVLLSAGPLYYHYLHEQGLVKNSTFSLFLGEVDEESYVHFGSEDFEL